MHADRTNRTALLLLSVLLIAAGGLGAAAGYGGFGSSIEKRTLTNNPVWRYVGAHGDWVWAAAAVLALLVLLAALRWLVALLVSTDRIGDIRITSNDSAIAGRTRLAGSALTEAVAEEIETYRGVDSATAYLIGDPDEPELVVTVVLLGDANFAAVRSRIETGAIPHARTAVGDESMPITLNLGVSGHRSARAR